MVVPFPSPKKREKKQHHTHKGRWGENNTSPRRRGVRNTSQKEKGQRHVVVPPPPFFEWCCILPSLSFWVVLLSHPSLVWCCFLPSFWLALPSPSSSPAPFGRCCLVCSSVWCVFLPSLSPCGCSISLPLVGLAVSSFFCVLKTYYKCRCIHMIYS